MSEFECDTPFFRSKLTRNVVITQLGPDAFSIVTDSETRSEYLKFVDVVGNSPEAKGYVLVNDGVFDGRVELEELIGLISTDESEYRVHGAYRGMLHDVIAARFRNSVGKLFFRCCHVWTPPVLQGEK